MVTACQPATSLPPSTRETIQLAAGTSTQRKPTTFLPSSGLPYQRNSGRRLTSKEVSQAAPRATRKGLSCGSRHHSQTFPRVSYKPRPFGPRLPTGAVPEREVSALVTASLSSAPAARDSHWACVGSV